jgi:hypothetical protein
MSEGITGNVLDYFMPIRLARGGVIDWDELVTETNYRNAPDPLWFARRLIVTKRGYLWHSFH